MKSALRGALIASLLLPAPSIADSVWGDFDALSDTEVPEGGEKDIFAGRLTLGYLASSGNTDTSSFNGKLVMGWDLEKWRHATMFSGIRSEENNVTTAENYQAGYKADRKFGEKNYLFATLAWEQDEFSGFEKRTTEAVGYGRRVLETDSQLLDLEIGAGARQSELTDGTERDETIGRVAGNYKWTFTETSDFGQQLMVESGSENTYTESVTQLSVKVMGNLDLAVSYTVKRNSSVPLGNEKMDTYTTVSVQYDF